MTIDSDHPDAIGVFDRLRKSWQVEAAKNSRDAEHRAGRLKSVSARVQYVVPPDDGRDYPAVPARTADGDIVTAAPALILDRSDVVRISEKFVRGLHFQDFGSALPAKAQIKAFLTQELDESARTELRKLPLNLRLAPGLRYGTLCEGGTAIWSFLLWGQVSLMAKVDH